MLYAYDCFSFRFYGLYIGKVTTQECGDALKRFQELTGRFISAGVRAKFRGLRYIGGKCKIGIRCEFYL